jgi:crotonobetainyl-CoA:carnitine CoA-transferase CaiB-like acyl-CoA transferase
MDTAAAGRSPLDDLLVLDLTIARAGPTAVRHLADWGARVLRVEPTDASVALLADHDTSDYINLHRSTRLIQLDLRADDDRRRFLQLVERADVLVENYRPPVKSKLGIDYEQCAAVNPRLVYGSISGYGQDGPASDKGAVDQVIQGVGGLMSITGLPDQGPVRAGIAVSDSAAGHQLAIGILVALHERARTGLGQWVRVSLLEAMITFLDFQAARWTIDGRVPTTEGNHHPTSRPMGTYRAADGHLNVAAPTDRLWARLCDVLGAPELAVDERFSTGRDRYRHRDALNDELEARFATRSREQWVAALDAAGIPCGPVLAIDEVFAHPQVRHLAMVERIEHPVRGSVDVLRNPITMTRSRPVAPTSSPRPGRDRADVLAELGLPPLD